MCVCAHVVSQGFEEEQMTKNIVSHSLFSKIVYPIEIRKVQTVKY